MPARARVAEERGHPPLDAVQLVEAGLVRWTGVPALSQRPPRRRQMRWWATIALALAFGGAIIAMAGGAVGRSYWFGYAVLMTGFAIGNLTATFGPLKPPGSLVEPVDEWDRLAR